MDNIGSKSEEYFDENSHVTSTGRNAIDEGRRSNSSLPTFSEASNFVCVSSSNDSLSENVGSKAIVKPFVLSGASENHGTHRTISYKCEGSKDAEVHDDGISSVSRDCDTMAVGDHCEKDAHSNGICCNSASVGSFASEESFRVRSSLPKLDSSQLPFVNEATGTNMPKIHSLQLHPQDSKFSPEISSKVYLKSEADTENSDEDSAYKAFKCSDDDEVKVTISSDLAPEGEPSLKDSVDDESEESDVMEHDVSLAKVCFLLSIPFSLFGNCCGLAVLLWY